jgi:hypothetical protein
MKKSLAVAAVVLASAVGAYAADNTSQSGMQQNKEMNAGASNATGTMKNKAAPMTNGSATTPQQGSSAAQRLGGETTDKNPQPSR